MAAAPLVDVRAGVVDVIDCSVFGSSLEVRARDDGVRRDSPASVRPGSVESVGSMGPLRLHAMNPRYFATPNGRAVYLAGSHTWNNLVDMDAAFPAKHFDFDRYLDFLISQGHNVTRLWTWEIPNRLQPERFPERQVAEPLAWARTGPGLDSIGRPKFDLTRPDPEYFRRLRTRVQAARARGLYVDIILFEGWVMQIVPGRTSHPFLPANNVNGTGYLTDVRDVNTLRYRAITEFQREHVKAVVDAVADLDNVLFEIANEAGPYSTDWQYDMIRFVQCYQATSGALSHPVGMSHQHTGGANATLLASPGDWIAPSWESEHYLTEPAPSDGRKVVIADTDHLGGIGFDDPPWVWRSLFRGINILYMDDYVGPDAVGQGGGITAYAMRAAIGESQLLANHVDIGTFVPSLSVASTGYSLVSPSAVLVLAPDERRVTVDLRGLQGELATEWLDTATGRVAIGDPVLGGITAIFRAPYSTGAVLLVRERSATVPSLQPLERSMQAVIAQAASHLSWSERAELRARALLAQLAASPRSVLLALCISLGIGMAAGSGVYGLLRRNPPT